MMRFRGISTVNMFTLNVVLYCRPHCTYTFRTARAWWTKGFGSASKWRTPRQVIDSRQHAPSIICTESLMSYQRCTPPVPCASSAACVGRVRCTTRKKFSSTKLPCVPSSGEPDLVGMQKSTDCCVGGNGPGAIAMLLFQLNYALTTPHRAQGEHIIRSQQALITSASHHHRAPHAQGYLPRAQLLLTACHMPNRLPHTIHRAPAGPLFKREGMLLRPVAYYTDKYVRTGTSAL